MAATSPRLKRIVINEGTPNRLALWECRSTDGTRGAGSGRTPAHAFRNWMASKGFFRISLVDKPEPCKHTDWELRTKWFGMRRWPYCRHCGIAATRWVD